MPRLRDALSVTSREMDINLDSAPHGARLNYHYVLERHRELKFFISTDLLSFDPCISPLLLVRYLSTASGMRKAPTHSAGRGWLRLVVLAPAS